ncbi:PLP-dependent transferase [Auricularia subglabra TFB-10046 SS5]|nr:PLP-dependent transferase [Auricularia subglabra TFB-10046 SS5]
MTVMHYAFFYGTLLRPDIVRHVLENDGSHLKAAPAILMDHTRVRIHERDYPAVVPSAKAQDLLFKAPLSPEQRSVQGILVSGITQQDMALLDDFEAEEYARELLPVTPLAPETPLDGLNVVPDMHKLPDGSEPTVHAMVYIWAGDYNQLKAEAWSYEEFVREKMWRWVNPETHFYTNALSVEFGHPMKKHFGLAEGFLTVNHGSYGTAPLRVIEYAEKLARQSDAMPDFWWRHTAGELLVQAREAVAKFLNVPDVDECVLVINATSGINHVMRNIEWNAGDVIVGNATTYGAIALTMQYTHDVRPHPEISNVTWTFPTTHDEIVAKFRAHLKSIKRHEGQKVVAIIDAISSAPGAVFPWERMVKVCKEENVWSVVDAAHAIGQIPIDLPAADPDFWVSNCHKWLYARKGCAVLYVPKRNQHTMKTGFPTSWEYESPARADMVRAIKPGTHAKSNFVAQFSAVGTMDLVPFMSVIEALAFRRDIGGEKAINAYCHFLALHAGKRIAELFGTRVMDPDGAITANMVNVLMPLPVRAQQTAVDLTARIDIFKVRMLAEHKCAVQTYVHDRKWWFRASAQIFNEISDYEFAAGHVKKICEELAAADVAKWGVL